MAINMKAVLAGAVLALGIGIAAPAAAEDLRVATEGAYPPFNGYNAAGELVGFDVDIANALCERAGFNCTLVAQEWDGIIPGLRAGKYDVIIASMTITDERREIVDFTNPYYTTPARFVAAKGSDLDTSPEGMAGKVVGAQSATVFANWLEKNYPDTEIRRYGSVPEHNADLVSGRLDAVLGDGLVLSGDFLKSEEGADYEFVGPELFERDLVGDGIGMVVRKGEDGLRERLNEALASIKADGTYAAINAKYFDIDISPQ